MSIPNDPLAEVAIQDIINVDSIRAVQTSFHTLFNTESMANFYTIGPSSSLACHPFKEYKNSTIEDSTNQPSNKLALAQKWEIIRHIRSRKPYRMLDNVITSIY